MLSGDDLSNVASSVKKYNAKVVALQMPEGLKTKAVGIYRQIEALGVEVIMFSDPCFGACDIPDLAMKRYGCDLIVHLGHSVMVKKLALPAVYVEYFSDFDVIPIIEAEVSKLDGFKTISLATTIQHIRALPLVKKWLEGHGKTVLVGKPKVAKYPGQLLGCDPSAALEHADEADCILFFGTGRFHPLGIAKKTDKPVMVLSIEDRTIYDLKAEQVRFAKRKIILKHKFDEAKTVCIAATTKVGQMNANVISLKKKIESLGKSAFIAVMDFIDDKSLLGMEYDIIVNTACPRIEEDTVFSKPVINFTEID